MPIQGYANQSKSLIRILFDDGILISKYKVPRQEGKTFWIPNKNPVILNSTINCIHQKSVLSTIVLSTCPIFCIEHFGEYNFARYMYPPKLYWPFWWIQLYRAKNCIDWIFVLSKIVSSRVYRVIGEYIFMGDTFYGSYTYAWNENSTWRCNHLLCLMADVSNLNCR